VRALSPRAVIDLLADNITYYKCDVSKWEEVEAISKKVVEEVGPNYIRCSRFSLTLTDRTPYHPYKQRGRSLR
jgi:hypothetical protein